MDKPSVGRIVHYNFAGDEETRLAMGGGRPAATWPAIIQAVEPLDPQSLDSGELVTLWVFGSNAMYIRQHVHQGDGPWQWNWPKRV